MTEQENALNTAYEQLKDLNNYLGLIALELETLANNASKIKSAYNTIDARCSKLDDAVAQANTLASKFIAATENFQQNTEKLQGLNKDFQSLTDACNKMGDTFQRMEAAIKSNININKIESQTSNIAKQLSAYTSKTETTNQALGDILSIAQGYSNDISQLKTKLLDSVEKKESDKERQANIASSEIKKMLLSFKQDIIASVRDDLVDVIRQEFAALKTTDDDGQDDFNALEAIDAQLENLGIEIDDDFHNAISAFLDSAARSDVDGAVLYENDESDFNIFKHRKNGKSLWTPNFYANVNKIEISDEGTLFYCDRIRNSSVYDQIVVKIEDIASYSLK